MGKLIVISAPSGAGKTSIVHYLLKEIKQLSFSISAASRKKRKNELNGKDYYFLTSKQFKKNIKQGNFLEWEEVYANQYYGTLKSELERIWKLGKHVIFDVDVIGGLNIKKKHTNNCLAIFIMPPSISVLNERLKSRGLDSEDSISKRIEKAEQEIKMSKEFDNIVLNDDLEKACQQTRKLINEFIKK